MASHQPSLPDYCPNCNTARTGNFCANCGQKLEIRREGFGHMLVHFVGHYFHYDNKFWSTLRLLLWKPGMLTRMYFEGKRASYINPIQLYIFVSAAFFILFTNSLHFFISQSGKLNTVEFYVGKERPNASLDRMAHVNFDSLRIAYEGIVDIYRYQDSVFRATPFTLSAGYLEDALGLNIARFAIENRLYTNGDIIIALMNVFIKSIPKMFFLLLPWFAFLLWVFFSRGGKFLYIDHGVFSLHFHAFTYLSVMVGVLLIYVWPHNSMTVVFMMLIPFAYLLVALRRFYQKSWLYTVIVGALVTFIYGSSISVLAFINVIVVMLVS